MEGAQEKLNELVFHGRSGRQIKGISAKVKNDMTGNTATKRNGKKKDGL